MAFSSFLEELKWRGLIHGDLMPGTEEHLAAERRTVYIGFDPTAESMTIGNYVQIMLLSFAQRAGHRPIFLAGGATGRIGDPSGKDKERQLKSFDILDANLAKFETQARRFLNFETGENAALLVNNLHFYEKMTAIDFLRDVGKHITVNYMMAKDSVKNRIGRDGEGMSFTEFSYQLLQGYDFNALFEKHNCTVQMGGSDQFGNITTGVELTRRISGSKVFAVVTPLLTKADGTKFGKSEAGNIWLDGAMTSPYQFFQFWINSDDADLAKFWRYFSFKTHSEIEAIESSLSAQEQKKLLAEELTIRVHSQSDFESVLAVSALLFDPKASRESLLSLDEKTLETVAGEIPNPIFSKPILENEGWNVADLMVETGVFDSKSKVREAIKGNALSINKQKITSHEHVLTEKDLLHGRFLMVENGKKNKFLLRAG